MHYEAVLPRMRLILCLLALAAVVAAPTAAADAPCDVFAVNVFPPEVVVEPDCLPSPDACLHDVLGCVQKLIQA